AVEFDQLRFEHIFHNILLHMGFEQCITRVIYPFLHRIGLLWLTGNVIPAQEHFASAIIRNKLIVATDGLDVPVTSGDHYLTFLPEGEQHELPLLYINYLLKKNGKRVTHLGPDVPLADIAYFVQHKRPTHLLTYLMTHVARPDLEGYIGLVKSMRNDAKVLVLGPVTAQLRHFEGITILKSQEELEAYLLKG
ncbi:MAG TPA: B12-binding domain-containing protein, partial [Chitinophaga sp.]